MGDIFISEEAYPQLLSKLSKTGHNIFKVKKTSAVQPAIASHPDIYMCSAAGTILIDEAICTEPDLHDRGILFEIGNIGREYPYDIPYNAVSTSEIFIHNTKYTYPELLNAAREAGLMILNVKQGYTKCSCVTVGDRAIITSDEGIYKTVMAYNKTILDDDLNAAAFCGSERSQLPTDPLIDILLLRPGYVQLKGMSTGFIGGASGTIGNTVYFNGDLSAHPDFNDIINFITDRGFLAEWIDDEPLADIGSIIYVP